MAGNGWSSTFTLVQIIGNPEPGPGNGYWIIGSDVPPELQARGIIACIRGVKSEFGSYYYIGLYPELSPIFIETGFVPDSSGNVYVFEQMTGPNDGAQEFAENVTRAFSWRVDGMPPGLPNVEYPTSLTVDDVAIRHTMRGIPTADAAIPSRPAADYHEGSSPSLSPSLGLIDGATFYLSDNTDLVTGVVGTETAITAAQTTAIFAPLTAYEIYCRMPYTSSVANDHVNCRIRVGTAGTTADAAAGSSGNKEVISAGNEHYAEFSATYVNTTNAFQSRFVTPTIIRAAGAGNVSVRAYTGGGYRHKVIDQARSADF